MEAGSKNGVIAVYLIKQHPLQPGGSGPIFQWLHFNNNFKRQLREWIGPYDPEDLTYLIDEEPSGEAWAELMEGLTAGVYKGVLTHLAPLSSAQRHSLIGICAEVGAQLITPSDAGRNRTVDS